MLEFIFNISLLISSKFSKFPFKKIFLYFFKLFKFSLKGPAGIDKPLPLQFRLLKHTKLKSYKIELSCRPSSKIATW